MVEPGDVLRAWQDVIKQLGTAAGSVAGQSDLVKQVVGPMQRQAELVEQVVRRQIDLERDLAGRFLAPVNVLIDAMDQTSTAMRTQAQAFDAASASFKQASELLEVQASLIERSVQAMRDPAEFVRAAGGAVRPSGGEKRAPKRAPKKKS